MLEFYSGIYVIKDLLFYPIFYNFSLHVYYVFVLFCISHRIDGTGIFSYKVYVPDMNS